MSPTEKQFLKLPGVPVFFFRITTFQESNIVAKKKIVPVVIKLGGKAVHAVETFIVPAIWDKVKVDRIDFETAFESTLSPVISADTENNKRKPDTGPLSRTEAATVHSLFGMDIHHKSQTVARRDSLGVERICSIKNPEQWKLFLLAVKHSGTLSKPQVHKVFSVKADRDRNVAALRNQLQKLQLTFNAEGTNFVLKEFSGQ